jgi:hypothetical protein
MKAIIVLIVVLVVGYAGFEFSTIYRNKSAIGDRVSHYLDFVDDASIDQVKSDLVKDAAELEVDLDPAAIRIVYQDTDRPTGPQKFVAKLATFENKQVAIHLTYVESVLGFKLRQEITRTKIKQVKVHQKVRPEYEELLR